ncbi:hypothetical protein SESBI_49449 [Sesbania bispinosa]|nr:hypothetical protein SESBI_49449 [Sesbania bispinosa]
MTVVGGCNGDDDGVHSAAWPRDNGRVKDSGGDGSLVVRAAVLTAEKGDVGG